MSGHEERRAGHVDWEALGRRVQAAAVEASGSAAADPARVREVLSRRARDLAADRHTAGPSRVLDIVTIQRSGERYAVESRYVHGVFRLAAVTPLPGVPAPVVGLAVWRGDLLVLLDRPAGRGPPHATDSAWVVVIGDDGAAFGLVSDDSPDIARVDRDALTPPSGRSAWGPDAALGSTPDAVLVLDGANLIRTYS